MGPSKKVSTNGKGAQYVVSKVRTTRFSVETAAGKSSAVADASRILVNEDGFPSIWFQSEAAFLRYRLFSNRETLPGRKIDFPFLEFVNFAYLGQFRSFGWMDFLGLSRGYSENVVRHFYANAELVEPKAGYFKTFVKGVAFEVDDNLFFRLYGIPIGWNYIMEHLIILKLVVLSLKMRL
ncbi:hypothetical protein Fot_19012 [Forsythia ovata]|uniref:Uncharacterized protein n=1 Tax=Forsythia ovata TaxID=205694 RepID=A0ABD1VK86_9LAMI